MVDEDEQLDGPVADESKGPALPLAPGPGVDGGLIGRIVGCDLAAFVQDAVDEEHEGAATDQASGPRQ